MYIRPFTTSRMITVRLPPPRLPGGISGSTNPHSSSVRSLGYRNLLRSYRPRFLLVHIGDPSSNQATTLESQMIHMIQELFEQTLRALRGCPTYVSSGRWPAVIVEDSVCVPTNSTTVSPVWMVPLPVAMLSIR